MYAEAVHVPELQVSSKAQMGSVHVPELQVSSKAQMGSIQLYTLTYKYSSENT